MGNSLQEQVLSAILHDSDITLEILQSIPQESIEDEFQKQLFTLSLSILTSGYKPTLAAVLKEGLKKGILDKKNTDKLNAIAVVDIGDKTLIELIDELKAEHGSWEPPIPFNNYDNTPFPIDVFPDWLKNYIISLARQMQVPLEMPALLAFPVLSLAVAKMYKVRARPGWIEGLNTYAIVALESGNRKSGTQSAMLEPVHDYELKLTEKRKPEWEQEKHELDCKKAVLEDLKKIYVKSHNGTAKVNGGKDKPSGRTATELKADIDELVLDIASTPEIFQPTLLSDDVTMEQMVVLLGQNAGCLGIFAAEGTLFNIALGRYSGSPSYDDLLKAYSNDPIRHDRIGRGRVDVPSPALTIGMSIQPVVLREIAENPAFRQKGMQARFLYAVPSSPLGCREINSEPIAENIRNKYFNGIRELLTNAWEGKEKEQRLLTLSSDANILLVEFERWLEPRLALDGDLRPIVDWAAKLSGALLRIAGLLHISNSVFLVNVVKGDELIISAETMSKAISLCDFLINHAKRAFDVMEVESEGIDKAKRILRWIEDNNIKEFKHRECHAALRGTFYKSENLKITLSLLVEYGYLKEVPDNKPGVGRKQIIYKINPLTTNTKNTTNEPSPSNVVKLVNVAEDTKTEITPVFFSEMGREVVGGDYEQQLY